MDYGNVTELLLNGLFGVIAGIVIILLVELFLSNNDDDDTPNIDIDDFKIYG